jgi:hypothetical protein
VLKTSDLRPCGEIPLTPESRAAIKALLCDPRGRLLALIYDNGEIEVFKNQFSPSGEILSTNSVHRGQCMMGRIGAVSACLLLDAIVYQSPDRRIFHLCIDTEGDFSSSETPADARTLMSCFGSNAGCYAWRDGNEYILAFAESNSPARTAYRTFAVCQFGDRLAVSTEESKLAICHWPSLDIETVLPCRLPVLSICCTDRDLLLMTDRHGNILSLDSNLEIVEHGRCSNDLHDDYPSAIYPTAAGALYISNWRCVSLSLDGAARRARKASRTGIRNSTKAWAA